MYREWKKIGFPKEYCIWIWKQQDQEVDQEIDGWMKWGRMEELSAERSGRKKCMTGRNGRGSWERQGITAFCTCQWIDWLIVAILVISVLKKAAHQKDIRKSDGTASHILNHCMGWMKVVSSTPRSFVPGEEPPISSGQNGGWAAELLWMQWRTEKFLFLPGIEAHSPSTTLTELS